MTRKDLYNYTHEVSVLAAEYCSDAITAHEHAVKLDDVFSAFLNEHGQKSVIKRLLSLLSGSNK